MLDTFLGANKLDIKEVLKIKYPGYGGGFYTPIIYNYGTKCYILGSGGFYWATEFDVDKPGYIIQQDIDDPWFGTAFIWLGYFSVRCVKD